MFKQLVFALLLMLPFVATSATLSGKIVDAKSGHPLPAANLFFAETNQGTTSGQNGQFNLGNVSAGDYTFVAKYVGYESFEVDVTLTENQEFALNIHLVPTALLGKEVIVVGNRAVKGETPAAFAEVAKEDLDVRYYAQDIPAILSELPSTTFYSESGNNIGYNYISIRGFGQRRISIMINGIPQNDPEDHNSYWQNFPDFLENVENIQVQRGAGSAFYGPPAIGGSVNIITSQYSAERKIKGFVGRGAFNTQKYSLSLNSGLLKNKYVVFARASQIKSDGFRDQSWVDFKSYFLGAARFGEKSTTRIQFYGGPVEDHLAYSGISKKDALDKETRKQNPLYRPDELENFNQPHLELIHEYQLTENLKLNNSVFGIRGYGYFDYDGSWAPMSYFRLTPEYGFAADGDPGDIYTSDLLIRAFVDNKQAGWLPQLRWDLSNGEMIVGAEIRKHQSLHWGRIQKANGDLPVGTSDEFSGLSYIGSRRYYEYKGDKDVVSPYVHTNLQLLPRTFVMLDVQFSMKKYRLFDEKFVGNEFDINYKFLNPRFGVNYKFTPELNMFGSISRTSREPRLKNFYDAAEASTPESWGAVKPQFETNSDGSFNYDQPLVNPESLTDLELGVGFEGRKISFNLNAFYMDFQDEIVKKGQLDRFGQPITGNAEQTLHQGVELQVGALITPCLKVDANATFSNNELKKHTVFDGDGEKIDLSGNPIAGFPNSLGNVRLTLNKWNLQSSLAMQYVGKFYTDNFKNEENTVDAHTVLHAMLGYGIKNIMGLSGVQLQLHIQNLLDKVYITHGEGDSFFPAAGRHAFVNVNFEL
jgi:iron complex outermembrane recepter protein